ncbi:MAG: hypothetical protein CL946_12130 [Ectothiorhodospiraceae bacterium]|nr:hypothetical protein [Ectothiorhodospiraceae bacterium]
MKDITDALIKKTPEAVRPKEAFTHLDVSVLTQHEEFGEEITKALLGDYFGEKMLRLKPSYLKGTYPGYLIVYENNNRKDYDSGIGLLSAALRELYTELKPEEPQTDPILLRFVNATPPFTRDVSIYFRDEFVRKLPLGENIQFGINGPLGEVTFQTEGGRCSVIKAPEEDAVALAYPPILTPGQRIICPYSAVTAIVGPPEL